MNSTFMANTLPPVNSTKGSKNKRRALLSYPAGEVFYSLDTSVLSKLGFNCLACTTHFKHLLKGYPEPHLDQDTRRRKVRHHQQTDGTSFHYSTWSLPGFHADVKFIKMFHRMEPCKSLERKCFAIEQRSPTTTFWNLSVRQECNEQTMATLIPNWLAV